MEGIPDPTPARPAPGAGGARRKNTLLGVVAVVLIIAAAGAYYYQTNRGPAPQPESVRTADTELRERLESKSPPPEEPVEPVEAGAGRRLQR